MYICGIHPKIRAKTDRRNFLQLYFDDNLFFEVHEDEKRKKYFPRPESQVQLTLKPPQDPQNGHESGGGRGSFSQY
jgi:hypothetical protein